MANHSVGLVTTFVGEGVVIVSFPVV